MTLFHVQNQWGGNTAPWHAGGVFNIGNRGAQSPVALKINSGDGGKSFSGTMTYQNEGPIGLRATAVTANTYQAENQWGGTNQPWHDAGLFLLGARNGQNAVAIDITSADSGKNFSGTMTYQGEGPIGFQGNRADGSAYGAKNQWGGNSAPWHEGGQWVLGCRADQAVVGLNVTSPDNGETLVGSMTYANEGAIGFRGTLTLANTYTVENQWGGTSAPWHPGGEWVIGCRGTQGVVAVQAESPDGKVLTGTMIYNGEGPIGLTLTRS
jgi:hypothetical protein